MKLVFRETVHWRVRNSQHLQLTGRIATSSLRGMAAGREEGQGVCMTIDQKSCVSTMSQSPTVRVGFWWLRAPLVTTTRLRDRWGTRVGTAFAPTISRFSMETQRQRGSVAMTWHSSFHWPSQPSNFWLSSGLTPLITTSASNWEPSVDHCRHYDSLYSSLTSIQAMLVWLFTQWYCKKTSPQWYHDVLVVESLSPSHYI